MFQGVILDIDDTIYDYTSTNELALNVCFKFLESQSIENIKELYAQENITVKKSTGSHNKLITFKRIIDKLKLSSDLLLPLEEMYWNVFSKIKLKEGVDEFLNLLKDNNIPVVFLTNFFLYHQLVKLKTLGIRGVDIISSEEVGVEKPDKRMFECALEKLQLNADQVCMIGDDYISDVMGAQNAGIHSFWLVGKLNFTWLKDHFENMLKAKNEMVELSRMFSDWEYTQAGGGNISVKHDEFMYIKGSGSSFKNVTTSVMFKGKCINGVRESIETCVHFLLKKYVVHLHPICVNRLTVLENGRDILSKLFPNALILDYATPGIKLAASLSRVYRDEKIIFLLNHGLIVTGNNKEEVIKLVKEVEEKTKRYAPKQLYTLEETCVPQKDSEIKYMAYCGLKEEIHLKPMIPDHVVYLSKVVYLPRRGYFAVHNTKEGCENIRDVFRSYVCLLSEKSTFLSENEIAFLTNWEAEKYRFKWLSE